MLNPKTPPHNLEAEQCVLGAILIEEKNIAPAEETLTPADFYAPAHAQIFECMQLLHAGHRPIDVVTLSSVLKDKNLLTEIGGGAYLAKLVAEVPMYTNIEEYCAIVKEKATLRRLISAATDILNESYGDYDSLEGVIERAEEGIFNVAQGKIKGSFVSIQDTLGETLEHIQTIQQNQGSLTGLSTGFKELDLYTSGLQKSDLIFIAARPSMGKTAFALNLAQNAAIKEKASVAIFSLEMSSAQLVQRMLCAEAMVDNSRIRTGDLTEEDWESLSFAYSNLFETQIFIDDTPGITLTEMRSKCRRLKTDKGLDMIMIDYLQLMSGSGRAENRQNEVSEISRGLKGLAREMNCPVVCLSQLSRAPEARTDHHPMMSDLRESGSIEQDADIVMFLYREHYYDKENGNPNVAELDVAKQRNGPTGRIRLAWLPEYTQFRDLAPENMEDPGYTPGY